MSYSAGMGESNCAWNRRSLLHRDTILAAAAIYKGKRGVKQICCTKDTPTFFLLFVLCLPREIEIKTIDTILLTVCAVTRKRWAELDHR